MRLLAPSPPPIIIPRLPHLQAHTSWLKTLPLCLPPLVAAGPNRTLPDAIAEHDGSTKPQQGALLPGGGSGIPIVDSTVANEPLALAPFASTGGMSALRATV